jgi:hypothetical protein
MCALETHSEATLLQYHPSLRVHAVGLIHACLIKRRQALLTTTMMAAVI